MINLCKMHRALLSLSSIGIIEAALRFNDCLGKIKSCYISILTKCSLLLDYFYFRISGGKDIKVSKDSILSMQAKISIMRKKVHYVLEKKSDDANFYAISSPDTA